jgi:anti-sigma factor RsiW
MRPIRDIDLMQLADGELGAEERAELEAALAANPGLAEKIAGIEEVGEVVRGELELAADEAEPRLGARMWAEIEKRMDLDAAPVKIPARTAAKAGFWGGVSRWIDTYRGHVFTGVLSAGAVAAIALVLRPEPRMGGRDATTQANVKQPGPAPVKQTDMVQVSAPSPVQIDSVEAPDGTSTVFTYETDDGEETTVIWVTPDDTVEGL